MKSIKNILFILIALTTLSCEKWLDVKPTSELDRSDLFSSENGYAEALSGIYANLTKPELYGRELTWGTLDVIAGVYYPSISGEYASILSYMYKRKNSNYDSNASKIIDNIWINMYKQIANLNSILETIDNNKLIFTEDNYNIIKGEALGLRAFLHFELLKMFGTSFADQTTVNELTIPYVTELSTLVTPIVTREIALNFIIEDLKIAKELLKNDPLRLRKTPNPVLAPVPVGPYTAQGVTAWHNRRFAFNYYASVATLARAYLWKGDKSNALTYAKEVIEVQSTNFPWALDANISAIGTTKMNQDKTFATEHIFSLNIKKINDYMQGFCYFGSSSWVYSSLAPFAYYSYGNVFEGSTDYRQLYLSTSYQGTKYCNKYYQVPDVYSFFQERVPLIRVSEMYYIASECETDLNQARIYLDAVRSHRGLSSMALSNSISRETLNNEIKKEYQKEFIGEGQIWYYIKRKNLDLTDYFISSEFNIYYFNNKNQFVFDRPDDEDGNRK